MTPAYGLKHWWRAERKPGESLKRFARRYRGTTEKTTAAVWLRRKRRNAR
jgi:hypothetical protein